MARITTLLIKVRLDDYSDDVNENDLDYLLSYAVKRCNNIGFPVAESNRTKTIRVDG
jgi:hypothetical protein